MSNPTAAENDLTMTMHGAVMQITLNRPSMLNAMGAPQLRQLMRQFQRAWRMPTVGAIVLTGAGRAFCAGHDLNSSDLGGVGAGIWNDLFAIMAEIPKPTLAAVNGVAVGGGLHLALACDLAYCLDTATVAESFVWIGASPDTGGHVYLQRSIGHQRAAEMLLAGRKLEAREAFDAGLFNGSFATVDELMTETLRAATHLALGPPLSHAVTRRGLEYARLHSVADVLRWEAEQEDVMVTSKDMGEGVAAFLEKRPATFVGE